MAKFLIQIDDFCTDFDMRYLFDIDIQVRISALLSSPEPNLAGLLRSFNRKQNVSVGVHGWNHFIEHHFGYWEARHLLETADSWECFDRFVVMPWNRMPRVGFVRAMKQAGYRLVTPYRSQALVVKLCGCESEYSKPQLLLHPPDFIMKPDDTRETIIEKWEEWKNG